MNDNSIRPLVAALISELEGVEDNHDEVTDSDVRDAMHAILTHHFVWGHPIDRFPVRFGMFSREGDLAVQDALKRFLANAEVELRRLGIPVGASRLTALLDEAAKSPTGAQPDEFFGFRDTPLPDDGLHERFFEVPDYDQGPESA